MSEPSIAPPAAAPQPAVMAWVRAHATPLPPEGAPVSEAEGAAIDRLARGARVIALGEPGHGSHEPLAYRNRLVRYLVEHQGVTAVAMETGIGETRRLADYVAGGPGDPDDLTRKYFSWNFNEFQANVELLRWLRAWNDDRPHRQVRLYGVDTSGGDARDHMSRASFALDDALDYLGRTVANLSRDVRSRLAPFAHRFSDEAYASFTADERADLSGALAAAQELFAAHRPSMVAASSSQQFELAQREVLDCRTLQEMFALWPPEGASPRPAPGDFEVVRIRDRAMADHLTWVLDREGPDGRVLLFQANGHVRGTPFRGWSPPNPLDPPRSTGEYMRARLGKAYRIVMTTSALGLGPNDARLGTLTRALASVGPPRLFLDLRGAPSSLWSKAGPTLTDDDRRGSGEVRPGLTLDAVVYFDRLTPESRLPAR